MLDIIYYSNVTETTHRFVQRLNRAPLAGGNVTRIPLKGDLDQTPANPYVLIIPTYGGTSTLERRKHVVPQIIRFLNNPDNRAHCIGVIACGNRNFGAEYGRAGNIVADKLGVPLLHKLELAGDSEDIIVVEHILHTLNTNLDQNRPTTYAKELQYA